MQKQQDESQFSYGFLDLRFPHVFPGFFSERIPGRRPRSEKVSRKTPMGTKHVMVGQSIDRTHKKIRRQTKDKSEENQSKHLGDGHVGNNLI